MLNKLNTTRSRDVLNIRPGDATQSTNSRICERFERSGRKVKVVALAAAAPIDYVSFNRLALVYMIEHRLIFGI